MGERLGRIIFSVMKPVFGLFMSGKTRTRGLILHGESVLLVRNWIGSQHWTLPGGGLRKKERPKTGLCRELYEELGLNIQPKLLRTLIRTRQSEGSAGFPVVIFEIELAKRVDFEVKHPEIIEAKWFSVEHLPGDCSSIVYEALGARRLGVRGEPLGRQ